MPKLMARFSTCRSPSMRRRRAGLRIGPRSGRSSLRVLPGVQRRSPYSRPSNQVDNLQVHTNPAPRPATMGCSAYYARDAGRGYLHLRHSLEPAMLAACLQALGPAMPYGKQSSDAYHDLLLAALRPRARRHRPAARSRMPGRRRARRWSMRPRSTSISIGPRARACRPGPARAWLHDHGHAGAHGLARCRCGGAAGARLGRSRADRLPVAVQPGMRGRWTEVTEVSTRGIGHRRAVSRTSTRLAILARHVGTYVNSFTNAPQQIDCASTGALSSS